MPRAKKVDAELDLLTTPPVVADEPLQASKEEDEIPSTLCDPPKKPKKIATEKQLEAMRLGREKRDEQIKLRRQAEEEEKAIQKKLLEDKIVKKAISIKKKEIKKSTLLDEISDDDTPIEEIKTTMKAKPIQKQVVTTQQQPKAQTPPAPKAIEIRKPTFYFV
ncbi:MAG: hypothetical protein NTW17_00245 [Candidatus Pacearchaeota archaeon]|nr:hypothetical protein [Candidatus Pacearchaeota archaeon]